MISFRFRSAEPEIVMDVEPARSLSLSLSPANVDVVCVTAPGEKARAPSHTWTDEETGFFLSLMQGDEMTIGYFNRIKLKKMPRMRTLWLPLKSRCCGFVAIFHHGYSRRVAGVIRLCHRYSFHSFNAEKFNSFYSIINEWPH